LERYKGKHYHGRGDGRSVVEVIALPEKDENEEPLSVISRRKTFDLIPMSEAEALEQMKLLGHDNFFIFFNAETDTISVLYRRRDETYGLIEPKVR
jgi:putative sigma-54 modulation protein